MTPPANIPRHVAIIMDGNGRWARQRGLPRIAGHNEGVQNVLRIIEAAHKLGIKFLTLYAFSVENWQRPPEEVDALMRLLEAFLAAHTEELLKRKIRLRIIGDISALPDFARVPLQKTLDDTAGFTENTLVLAINYGARTEVLSAVKKYISTLKNDTDAPADLDWDTFSSHLDTGGIPDPDLIIRSSGEHRLSNFLLLQGAYAEIIFSPVLWPDFNGEELEKAISEFSQRERRFGKTGEQIRGNQSSNTRK